MTSIKYSMTKEQQEIFDYSPLNMVITAPAGCGKTEALACRAKGLLERYDFSRNGRKLLVVSFTNQARDNIYGRIKKYVSVQTLRQYVDIYIFHGLAARIIRAHGNVIGVDGDWTIASSDWVGKCVYSLNCEKKIKNQIKSALQKIKLECVTDDEVNQKVQEIGESIGKYVRFVERKRIEAKIITYDDQIRIALWILQNKRVAKLYRNHFFAALVDEFQDLTSQQLLLIQILCGNNVTFAGDLAQGIYSFAGADAEATFREITKRNGKQVELLKSFRSSPAVLDAVNSLSSRTAGKHLVSAFPEHWGDGGLSSYASFEDENAEAEKIAQICQLILKHCPSSRIGIISRTAFRAKTLKDVFAAQGISFIDWGDGLFSSGVVRILRKICDYLPNVPREEWRDSIGQYVLAANVSASEELKEAIEWLYDQLLQLDTPDFCDIKKRINVRKGNETVATCKGIHCLTGHAGKGQQFDWVIIVGLEQGTIPFYKAESLEEKNEEARVLSVMISRARIGFMATSAMVNPYGRRRSESEFLYYLKTSNMFLFGQDKINRWFDNADWSTIVQM